MKHYEVEFTLTGSYIDTAYDVNNEDEAMSKIIEDLRDRPLRITKEDVTFTLITEIDYETGKKKKMYEFDPSKPAWFATTEDLLNLYDSLAEIYTQAGHKDMLDAMFERNTYLANDNASIMERYYSMMFNHFKWITAMIEANPESHRRVRQEIYKSTY